ncbi:MAG: polyprenyl diphosphate synthase [Candidatus Margulisiibacteriota bacterium]
MDGNGRWAKRRKRPRIFGHKEGAESLRAVLKGCAEFGVKYLTVYAFSTENWGRPRNEVDFLMNLFSVTIDREMDELMRSGVKLQFLGRLAKFSAELRKKMNAAMEKTRDNKRITLSVMVNYGGRAEIVDAVNRVVESRAAGHGPITEEEFSKHLYTAGMPDPDLLIRTANEMRVSNYLLWQIAYAEIYVTETLWPDFRRAQLIAALEAYQKRERRYGKL